MTSMQETIAYNNVGVALLEMGSIHEARELFGLAIEGMKGVLDSRRADASGMQSTDAEAHVSCSLSSVSTNTASPSSPSMMMMASAPVHPPQEPSITPKDPLQATSPSTATNPATTCNRFYDFLRPVFISEDEFLLSNAPMVKLTISLLFNLAISDHASAMMSSEEEETSFYSSTTTTVATVTTAANAIFLYQLAYCLQLKDGIELSRIHTMGMINNVGRLLAFLGDTKESENCFRHLLKKLMVQVVDEPYRRRSSSSSSSSGDTTNHNNNNMIVDRTNTNNTSNHRPKTMMGEEVELEGFLSNVMHVVLRHNLSSPAA
jgi:hypothetical protein